MTLTQKFKIEKSDILYLFSILLWLLGTGLCAFSLISREHIGQIEVYRLQLSAFPMFIVAITLNFLTVDWKRFRQDPFRYCKWNHPIFLAILIAALLLCFVFLFYGTTCTARNCPDMFIQSISDLPWRTK